MSATHTAFLYGQRLITAPLSEVLTFLKRWQDAESRPLAHLLVINDLTGQAVDFNLYAPLPQLLSQAAPSAPSPKVPLSREVKLLPRHWEWLAQQPSGAPATLRRFIDTGRKARSGAEQQRRARDATGRLLTLLAGDQMNYETLMRALYAGDQATFEAQLLSAHWCEEWRAHLLHAARDAF